MTTPTFLDAALAGDGCGVGGRSEAVGAGTRADAGGGTRDADASRKAGREAERWLGAGVVGFAGG
jgi:hypothetical protein